MLHHGGNSLAVSSPDYLMESKTEALDSNYKKRVVFGERLGLWILCPHSNKVNFPTWVFTNSQAEKKAWADISKRPSGLIGAASYL